MSPLTKPEILYKSPIQAVYMYTLLSRKLDITLLCQYGLNMMIFFQKYIQYGNGGEKTKPKIKRYSVETNIPQAR